MRLPHDMHPLARRAAVEAMRGFTAEFLRQLAQDLLADASIRDAVRELIFLGVVLEESGHSPEAAALFKLMESQAVLRTLDRANASWVANDTEAVNQGAKRFDRFVASPRAMRVSEGVPLRTLGAQRFAGLRLR